MRSPKYRGERVYIVVWPERRIVKGGYTGGARWRTFVNRGAVLHQLTLFDNFRPALAYEADVLAALSVFGPLAFRDRYEAEPLLGAGGGGWCETYLLPDLAMLGALPEPPPEHCLENPPSYFYEQCRVDVQAMHVRNERDGLTEMLRPPMNPATNASPAGGLKDSPKSELIPSTGPHRGHR